jgi:hypothetical protein
MNWILPFVATSTSLIGCAILLAGLWKLTLAHNSKHWPIANGRIIHSNTKPAAFNCIAADIKYEYEVNGIIKTGTRIQVLDWSDSTGKMAERIITKYPIGSKVNISYSPKKTSYSLLEPGRSLRSIITILIGFLFPVTGLSLFWFINDIMNGL